MVIEIMTNFIITPAELNLISNNLVLTNHAKDRIEERLAGKTLADIREMIKHPLCAWNNTDNTKCIAIDNYRYFVVVKSKTSKTQYVLITIKEKSKNDVPVTKKFVMAFFGKNLKKRGNENVDCRQN